VSESRGNATIASPLWPLTVVLGEIARRIERHRTAEHGDPTTETRRTAGDEPAAREEAA